MFKQALPLLLLTALLSGCETIKSPDEEIILDESQQQNALKHSRPPYQFGYTVQAVQGGIAMKAQPRLHPNQMAEVSYLTDDYPLVQSRGKSSRQKMNILIDTASPISWMEFGTSENFNAYFLELDGYHIPYRGNLAIGPVDAYAAAVTHIRFDQLSMEDAAFFVRMAKNSLGPMNRGIRDERVDAVLGYDMLKNFSFIQFDMQEKKIFLSATKDYTADVGRLVGRAAIVSNEFNTGLIVNGAIDGEALPIMLDFAGQYFFRRSDSLLPTTDTVSLGEIVYSDAPTIRGTFQDQIPRAGSQMLEKYLVTVCPREGVVYFERPRL